MPVACARLSVCLASALIFRLVSFISALLMVFGIFGKSKLTQAAEQNQLRSPSPTASVSGATPPPQSPVDTPLELDGIIKPSNFQTPERSKLPSSTEYALPQHHSKLFPQSVINQKVAHEREQRGITHTHSKHGGPSGPIVHLVFVRRCKETLEQST